jgi:hypothetical protein
MLEIVPRHETKGIGADVLAAKEPVATSVFSQADEVGASINCHLPAVNSLEVLDGFPDGESLRVGEGEQVAMVQHDVVREGRRQRKNILSFSERITSRVGQGCLSRVAQGHQMVRKCVVYYGVDDVVGIS